MVKFDYYDDEFEGYFCNPEKRCMRDIGMCDCGRTFSAVENNAVNNI